MNEEIFFQNLFFTWDIHYNCNYNCSYCFLNFELENKNIDSLNLMPDEWIKIWSRFYQKYGACHILITGGEPFIYYGFISIVSYLQRYHTFEFSTNLSFDENEFINKMDYKRVKINASFHPEYVSIKDFIRKVKKIKDKGFNITSTIVAYPEFLDKIAFWKREHEKESIRTIVYPYRGPYKGRKFPDEYSNEEKKLLEECASVTLGRKDTNEKLYKKIIKKSDVVIEDDKRYYEKKESSSNHKVYCFMGKYYGKILPDGNVYRCCAWSRINEGLIGNITNENFSMLDEVKECWKLNNGDCVCFKAMINGEEKKWQKEWRLQADFSVYFKVKNSPNFTAEQSKQGEKIEEQLKMAFNLRDKGKIEESIKIINDILEENPNYYRALLLLSEIYISQKKYDIAEKLVKKSIKIEPKYSWSYRVLGNIYFFKQDYDKAIKNFDEAIKKVDSLPDEIDASYNLSQLYYALGNENKAIKILNKICGFSQEMPRVIVFLGEIYTLKEKYKIARKFLEKVIKFHKKGSWTLRALGCLHYQNKNWQRAIRCFNKAIVNPEGLFDKTQSYLFLSKIYLFKKEKDKSLEYINYAIELSPEMKIYEQYKKEIVG